MNQNPSMQSLKIAVLTISDTRTEADDKSGKILVDNLTTKGHLLAEKVIVPDNIYQIRAVISRWVADESVQSDFNHWWYRSNRKRWHAEAIKPLLDKEIEVLVKYFG